MEGIEMKQIAIIAIIAAALAGCTATTNDIETGSIADGIHEPRGTP